MDSVRRDQENRHVGLFRELCCVTHRYQQGPELRVNVCSSLPSCGSDVATVTVTSWPSGLEMVIENAWTIWETLSC